MECFEVYGAARKERKTKEQLKIESQEKQLAEGKEMILDLRAQLSASKRFNKAAGAMLIIMLIIMSFMVKDMSHWANQYEQLEGRYEELYEELKGGENQ
jgi:hypothetical protein